MTDYVDIGLKVFGLVGSIAGAAATLAWWLGSRMDRITTQISRLELRMAQRLTRLETKIFNGVHLDLHLGDESHDD